MKQTVQHDNAKHSNTKIIVALMLATSLAGCGGGGKVDQPVVAPLATAEFVSLAKDASCANLRNRLFVIDQKQVFWDKAGTCADASYSQVLFGNTPQTILCTSADSIAGPRTFCNDQQYLDLFQTITKNLDKADLGLGSAHQVQQLSVPAGASTSINYTQIVAPFYFGAAPANIVLQDATAWNKFWQLAIAPAPAAQFSEADFSSKMVLGTFFKTPNDCSITQILRVSSDGQKIRVEYRDEERISVQSCNPKSGLASTPMNLVALDKLALPVEFVNVTAAKVAFQTLDLRSYSAITSAQNLLIKDEASWAKLWTEHVSNMMPAPPMPSVDFSKNMVLALFMGQKPNGCYGINVVNVWRAGGKLSVAIHYSVPAEASICTMSLTSPAELIQLARTDEPVEFILVP